MGKTTVLYEMIMKGYSYLSQNTSGVKTVRLHNPEYNIEIHAWSENFHKGKTEVVEILDEKGNIKERVEGFVKRRWNKGIKHKAFEELEKKLTQKYDIYLPETQWDCGEYLVKVSQYGTIIPNNAVDAAMQNKRKTINDVLKNSAQRKKMGKL